MKVINKLIIFILVATLLHGCTKQTDDSTREITDDTSQITLDYIFFSEPIIRELLNEQTSSDNIRESCGIVNFDTEEDGKLKSSGFWHRKNDLFEFIYYNDIPVDEGLYVQFSFYVVNKEEAIFEERAFFEVSVKYIVNHGEFNSSYTYNYINKSLHLTTITYYPDEKSSSSFVLTEANKDDKKILEFIESKQVKEVNKEAINKVIRKLNACDELSNEYFDLDWQTFNYFEFDEVPLVNKVDMVVKSINK